MQNRLSPKQKRCFILTLLVSLLLFLYPRILPQPEYDQLTEGEIVVEYTYYSSGRHGSGGFLRDSGGTSYKLSGDLSSRTDFESLTPGTAVQIKYYRGLFRFFPMNFIEELSAGGKTIVSYTNSQTLLETVCTTASAVALLFGLLYYAGSIHLYRQLRSKYRRYQKKQKKLRQKDNPNT